jgi:hypothetical protein
LPLTIQSTVHVARRSEGRLRRVVGNTSNRRPLGNLLSRSLHRSSVLQGKRPIPSVPPGNLGKGDLNVYRIFLESALVLARPNGVVAQLVPEGLYNGANAAAIRSELFEHFRLDRLFGFENTKGVWFPGVDTRAKFCLYVASKGGSTDSFRIYFRVNSVQRLTELGAGRTLTMPMALVKEFSPDALTVMEFLVQTDIDVCRKVYARYPKFGESIAGLPNRIYMREIDMTNNSDLFTDEPGGLPLFEGRMVDLFDYRAKGYSAGRGRAAEWTALAFGDPRKAILPQWRIPVDRMPDSRLGRIRQYRIGYGWVASPTNERSLIAALIPPETICGNSVPTIVLKGGTPADMLLWLGVANSLNGFCCAGAGVPEPSSFDHGYAALSARPAEYAGMQGDCRARFFAFCCG